MEKPKGTYKCDRCNGIWDGSELYQDPQSLGCRWTCGYLPCAASVFKISDLPKGEYLERIIKNKK